MPRALGRGAAGQLHHEAHLAEPHRLLKRVEDAYLGIAIVGNAVVVDLVHFAVQEFVEGVRRVGGD
jgi:hypothetical protein